MADTHRLDHVVVKVSGPDAVGFLDNLLTQNVGEGVRYAALLTPQGKVVADMFVWGASDGVLIDVAQSLGDELIRKLTLYKLRAAVTVERIADRCVLWSAEPFASAQVDPRFPDGALGWRAIAPSSHGPSDEVAYDELRLRLGVPDLSLDAKPEEVFGLEALLEELHGVDFAKGCFVGQENVSRMKRRATTRRKFCAITFTGAAPPPFTPINAGPAEIGSVRSGAPGRAIALVRLDRAAEAQATGNRLEAGEVAVALDPPAWLLQPPCAEN